jgi:hypothetical protein
MKAFPFLAVLLLSSLAFGATASAAASPQPPRLVIQPGETLAWESTTLRGTLALEIHYHPAPGTCNFVALFGSVGDSSGPVYLARGMSANGTPNGLWGSQLQPGGWVGAAGLTSGDVAPDQAFSGGIGTTDGFDVSQGAVYQVWAVDLDGRGAEDGKALNLRIDCSARTEVSIRAAREALLAMGDDFRPAAGGGAGAAGDAAILGSIAQTASGPVDWWYNTQFGASVVDLRVTSAAGERHYTTPSTPRAQEPLPAGDVRFGLTEAGVGFNFMLGAAVWQPVHDVQDIEALPAWGVAA